ncbi:hypothetical protein D9M71_726520 [compost metagenome]
MLGGGEFDQVGAPRGGDDQVGLEVDPRRLDQHADTQLVATAAGGVADDPAHGVASRHSDQLLADLQVDRRYPPRAGVHLIQGSVGVGPHLDGIDVALPGGGDTCVAVGA